MPAFALAGVPVSFPVAILKVAQAGLFWILKLTVLPLATVTVGVKVYACPTWSCVAGAPLIVGAEPEAKVDDPEPVDDEPDGADGELEPADDDPDDEPEDVDDEPELEDVEPAAVDDEPEVEGDEPEAVEAGSEGVEADTEAFGLAFSPAPPQPDAEIRITAHSRNLLTVPPRTQYPIRCLPR